MAKYGKYCNVWRRKPYLVIRIDDNIKTEDSMWRIQVLNRLREKANVTCELLTFVSGTLQSNCLGHMSGVSPCCTYCSVPSFTHRLLNRGYKHLISWPSLPPSFFLFLSASFPAMPLLSFLSSLLFPFPFVPFPAVPLAWFAGISHLSELWILMAPLLFFFYFFFFFWQPIISSSVKKLLPLCPLWSKLWKTFGPRWKGLKAAQELATDFLNAAAALGAGGNSLPLSPAGELPLCLCWQLLCRVQAEGELHLQSYQLPWWLQRTLLLWLPETRGFLVLCG